MSRIPLALFLAVLILGCSSEPASDITESGNIAGLDSLIQQEIDRNHIPGAVIRVQQGDSILHYRAYGFAQKYNYSMEVLDEPKRMTREHIFDLASLTKVFATTCGVMLLVGDGEIELDDPIHKYLPGFDEGEKSKISIRHLLTHSSGLAQWYPLYYKASDKNARLEVITSMPLKWPVGESRHYSDLGFMLLGDIIEKVSGKPLALFVNEELYQPLNLQYTMFNPDKEKFRNIAATSHGNPFERRMVYDDEFGYKVDVDPESWNSWREYTLVGEVNDGNAWYANNGVAGHAGLFSTATDLQFLVNLLLNKGKYRGEQLISESVIDTFLTEDKYGNGLGWAMEKETIAAKGTPVGTFGHTGFTGTNVVIIPEYNLSVILLTNRQNVGPLEDGYYFNLHTFRQSIIDIIMDQVIDL